MAGLPPPRKRFAHHLHLARSHRNPLAHSSPSPDFSFATLPPPFPPPSPTAPVAGQIAPPTPDPAAPVYFPPDPIVFAIRRAWCKELRPHGPEELSPTPLTPKRRSQARSGTRTTAPPSINCKVSSSPSLLPYGSVSWLMFSVLYMCAVYFQSTCCVQNPTLAHVVGCLILESQVNAYCYVRTAMTAKV